MMKRLLKLTGAAPEQIEPTVLAFLAFACVLFSYFLIVPIREEIAILLGVTLIPKLFTASLLVTLLVAPVTATGISRGKRGQGHFRLFLVLALILAAFYVAVASSAHARANNSQLSTLQVAILCLFYVWLGTQSLLTTSSLWALCADVFDAEAAAKLFGFIGAGATLGQLLGSAASVSYVSMVRWTGPGPPFELLLVAAGMLTVTAWLSRRLANTALGSRIQPAAQVMHDHSHGHNPSHEHKLHTTHSHETAWAPRRGFLRMSAAVKAFTADVTQSLWLIACSPYLLSICGFTALTYMSSAIVYFERTLVVSITMNKASDRAKYFAYINMATAVMIFSMQLLATGRILKLLGVRVSLCIGPGVALAGMLLVSWHPTTGCVAGVEVVRKVLGYSLSRPTREVLFTVVSREEKYRAKMLIDMVVQRVGDGLAAALFQSLATTKPHSKSGPRTLALAGCLVCCGWVLVAYILGKQYRFTRLMRLKDNSFGCEELHPHPT